MISKVDRFAVSPAGNWERSKAKLFSDFNTSIYTKENNNISTYHTCSTENKESTTNNINSTDDVTLMNIKTLPSEYYKIRSNLCTQFEARPTTQQTFQIIPYKPTHDSSHFNDKKRLSKHRTFGDHFGEKRPDHIRIVSQNINCLGIKSKNNPKQEQLINWLIQNEIDIIGWQEIGIAFHLLPYNQRLTERIKDPRWAKIRISSSNNKHERIERFQYGGTAVATFDEAAHRIKSTGGDTTGLGRWSWTLFEGRNKFFTRIISAYVPCKSADDRRKTVYNQHKRYFLSQGNDQCPRELFRLHLVQLIKTWQKQNENIVLLIDMNENLNRMGPLQSAFKYECQLIDPIREMHHDGKSILPPTSLTGSVPIDGIFVSPALQHISKGGWMSIDESIGDHRALFIDIPLKVLLGENPFQIHRHTARRLVCDKPKVVEKFNKLLRQQLESQYTIYQFNSFMEKYEKKLFRNSKEAIECLNKIDRSITNSIKFAEKKCRKLNAGDVPYSPELSATGKLIHFWNTIIRKKKGCNISSKYIQRSAKKLKINNAMQLELHDCENERKLAMKKYTALKKNAQQSRTLFLHDLASQHAARGNETISNVILRMHRNEELRNSYRRIKNATKPFCGATDKVLTKVGSINQQEVISNEKEIIEKALCEENKQKFTMAYSSPFLQKPLTSLIHQTATSTVAQKILNGTFSTASLKLSTSTKSFIEHFKKPKSIAKDPPNDTNCSLHTAMSYWRKKREKTNSSMSQRHIGTYKAITYDLPLLNIDNKVSNIAFQLGEPLERWTFDLDVSLLKKPNKFRPSELRTIGTLEADFNQNASLHFSKRMMGLGIERGAIPLSQYAKKGNRSVEAALVKIMIFDQMRFNKINGSFIAMDLMNCFDRMAHPVSSLAAQRLGVHPNIAACMIKTLCQMKHFIRTAYGDSTWSYTGTPSRPLQGAVQGNGAASPIFIAISCVILSYLQSQAIGIQFMSAITMSIFSLIAILYVDDSDILVAAICNDESDTSIFSRTQKAATAYHTAVHQTGGAVRPDKCRWYSIQFEWKQDKWSYRKKYATGNLQIMDTNSIQQSIQSLCVTQGWKGLGVVSSPSGNWDDHVKYLISEKIIPWNNGISSSYLQKHDVYRAATTSIFKTIDYSLPTTFLTSRQCHKINVQLHKKYIPRIGVDIHLPLVYRYAPLRYQGLHSLHVEEKQFIEKLKIFLYHASTDTQLAHMIKHNLESLQLILGSNHHIFHLPYEKYGMLAPKSWITHLWEMSCKYEVQIDGYYEKITPTRKHDQALMDTLISSNRFSSSEIEKINYCRIHLQVHNVSDIVNGNGSRIDYCAIHHIKNPDRISIYKWPNQPKPSKACWRLWDEAISSVWSMNDQYKLPTMLGHYIQQPPFTSPWLYHSMSETLYYKISTISYSVYKKSHNVRTRTREGNFTLQYFTFQIPNEVKQAIVNRVNPRNVILEYVIDKKNFEEKELPIHSHIELFFEQVKIPDNVTALIQQLKNGKAVAVSDASVHPDTNIGASSFLITTDDLQCSCSGSHGVPSGSERMDSYRAELYGIFSILCTLWRLCKWYDIQDGTIIIACDNKASLENSLKYDNRAAVTRSSHDMLWAIQDLRKDFPIKIIHKHVKGHQDTKSFKSLTLLEKLNCFTDLKADEYRKKIEMSNDYEYSMLHYFSNWHCKINNNIITSKLEKSIKDHIYKKKIQSFLHHNKGYTMKSFEYIDWEVIESATNMLSLSRRIWLTKFVSGFSATAVKMHERGQWESPLCPICNVTNENTKHIFACLDHRVDKKYKNLLRKFAKFLDRLNTHPDIITIFHDALEQQHPISFSKVSHNITKDHNIIVAAQEQDEIKWHNFFKGHISKAWKTAQLKYFNEMFLVPPSVDSWLKQIIHHIYNFSFEMWNHRNSIVHEKKEEFLNQKESTKLENQIIRSYLEGSQNVLPKHRYMFNDQLRDILHMSVKEKQYWVLTVDASRKCYEMNENVILHENDACAIEKRLAIVPD